MRCLVVKAHPLAESLCSMLTQRITAKLTAVGHDVTVEDLYAEKFEAALTVEERAGYYDGSYATYSVAVSIERLESAEAIVLVFPTWWFSFPAVLKGWFDRVWAPGVAYDHADEFGPIRPKLHNLRRMLVVTSLGSPAWVDLLVMRQPVKRVLKTAILKSCAPNCRFQMLSIYKSEQLAAAQVDAFWMRIEGILTTW